MQFVETDGNKNIFVFDNVRTLVNRWRPFGAVGGPQPAQSQQRSRDIPPPFRDTRTQESARTSYVETQKTLEKRIFNMAADSSHGAAKTSSPSWVGPLLASAIVFVLVCAGVVMLANWLTTGQLHGGPRVVTVYDNTPQNVELRIVRPSGSPIVTTLPSAAPARTVSRVPSPEEIDASVPHKRTRTAVPCIDGYEKNPANNLCDLVSWTPGPDPE